jgi:hypothetical protein
MVRNVGMHCVESPSLIFEPTGVIHFGWWGDSSLAMRHCLSEVGGAIHTEALCSHQGMSCKDREDAGSTVVMSCGPRWFVISILSLFLATPFHACSASPSTRYNAATRPSFPTVLDTNCLLLDHLVLRFGLPCAVTDDGGRVGAASPIGMGGNGRNNERGGT